MNTALSNPLAPDDLKKSFVSAMSHPSEDIARTILAQAGVDPDRLEKNISTATGLVAFDLQAPAKNLFPAATPLRNRVPRVAGAGGTATNWRQVSSLIGSGYDAIGWVAEGQRAGQMSYVTASKSAPYVTLGEEDSVTFEAINAAVGFEDIQASMAMRLLQKTMLKEEMIALVGVLVAAGVNVGGYLVAWGAMRSSIASLGGRITSLEGDMRALDELKLDVARLETRLDALIEQVRDLNALIRWMRDPPESRSGGRRLAQPAGG